MSRTTPTVTPEIFTGLPSARPAASGNLTLYSFLRAKTFCSEPMKNRNTINTTADAVTSAPTRIVFSFCLTAIDEITNLPMTYDISAGRLRRGNHTRFEEVAQAGMIGIARRFH